MGLTVLKAWQVPLGFCYCSLQITAYCLCPHGLPKLWLSLLPLTAQGRKFCKGCRRRAYGPVHTAASPSFCCIPCRTAGEWDLIPHVETSGCSLHPQPEGNVLSLALYPQVTFLVPLFKDLTLFPHWGLICLLHNKKDSWTAGYVCVCPAQIPDYRNYRA